MNNKSHLTAITRKTLSAPMHYLFRHALIQPGLDYGCGKGTDATILGLEKYDPYYFPCRNFLYNFNLITCIYVLNVLLPAEQVKVAKNIEYLLAPHGVAYFAVRRDVKQDGLTTKGTYQCNVVLDLPKLVENKNFCIYKMEKI